MGRTEFFGVTVTRNDLPAESAAAKQRLADGARRASLHKPHDRITHGTRACARENGGRPSWRCMSTRGRGVRIAAPPPSAMNRSEVVMMNTEPGAVRDSAVARLAVSQPSCAAKKRGRAVMRAAQAGCVASRVPRCARDARVTLGIIAKRLANHSARSMSSVRGDIRVLGAADAERESESLGHDVQMEHLVSPRQRSNGLRYLDTSLAAKNPRLWSIPHRCHDFTVGRCEGSGDSFFSTMRQILPLGRMAYEMIAMRGRG